MIRSLPLYERKNKIFIEIFGAEVRQFELMDEQISDIRKQLIVDTATWGLKIYEKELKIIVPTNSTLESRRAAIKAKWRSGGKVDRMLLESVASAILQTVVKVEFDGRVVFYFDASRSEVSNFGVFRKIINEIKPAHLPLQLEARLRSFYIELSSLRYNYINPLPVCGAIFTNGMPGTQKATALDLSRLNYTYPVQMPITGEIYTNEVMYEW